MGNSSQVGTFIQLLFMFLAGFAVAFVQGWKLTLVMVATIPLLALSGGLMAMMVSKMSGAGQEAYAEAGTTVEQVVSSVRTVRILANAWCSILEILASILRISSGTYLFS